MSIIITNITPDPQPTGEHEYRVSINGWKNLFTFKHYREQSISALFEAAWKAAMEIEPGNNCDMIGRQGEATMFDKAAADGDVKCDLCGEIMHPMYGAGWDNDRMVCADRSCDAEIVYPTSTRPPGMEED